MEIPVHLTYEIRSRLPPKALVRFRCVASAWNNITGDGCLVRKQLMNPTEDLNPGLLCFVRRHSRDSIEAKILRNYVELVLPRDCCYLNGSCNGWLCYGEVDRCPVVCNPARQETLKLPPLITAVNEGYEYKTYGLGFDGKRNLFKLFCVLFNKGRLEFFKFMRQQNCWNRMESPTRIINGDSGRYCGNKVYIRFSVFANGAVHYHLSLNSGSRQVIAAIDVETEELRVMPFPLIGVGPSSCRHHRHIRLTEIRGVLTILESFGKYMDQVNVHMMVKGGRGEEWSLVRSIPSYQVARCFGKDNNSFSSIKHYRPSVWEDQVIVQYWDGEAVACDINTGTMKLLPLPTNFDSKTPLHSLQLTFLPLYGLHP